MNRLHGGFPSHAVVLCFYIHKIMHTIRDDVSNTVSLFSCQLAIGFLLRERPAMALAGVATVVASGFLSCIAINILSF